MMLELMREAGIPCRHVIIWVKNSAIFSMGRLDYDYQHEPLLYGWATKHKFYGNGRFTKSVWEIPKPHRSGLHPTTKPLALVENALQNSSQRGDVVLDPFCGSGTTLIASERLGRKCRAMEIEPHYCDVIIKRFCALTGESEDKIHGSKSNIFTPNPISLSSDSQSQCVASV